MIEKIEFYSILGGAGHGKGYFLNKFEILNEKKLIKISYSTTMKSQMADILITDKERKLYKGLSNLEILNELKDNRQDYKIFKNFNTREIMQRIGTEFYRGLSEDIHIKFEALKMIKQIKASNNIIFISDDTRFENELSFIMGFNNAEDKIDYLKYIINRNNEIPSNEVFFRNIIKILNIKKEDKKEILVAKKLIKRFSIDIDNLRKKYIVKNEYEDFNLNIIKNMSVEEAYKNKVIAIFRPIVHPELIKLYSGSLEDEIENYTKLSKEEIKSIKENYKKSNIEWNLKNVKKYGYARSNISHKSERELDLYRPEEIIVEPIKNKKDENIYFKKIKRLVSDKKWTSTIDKNHNNQLKIAFSAGALFDMKEAEEVFKKDGLKGYRKYLQEMSDNDKIFGPGPALSLYHSFKNLSKIIDKDLLNIEFVLISKIPLDVNAFWNSYDNYIVDLNEFNSISLGVSGISNVDCHVSSMIDLSITTSKETAESLHEVKIPALYIPNISKENNEELYKRKNGGIFLISDFDGVISDSNSEKVYQDAKKSGHENPVNVFVNHEMENAEIPMELGPIGKVIKKLSIIIKENQNYKLENNTTKNLYPFDSTIITARDGNARKRFLNTLMAHNITVGSFHMMGGLNKNNPLSIIESQIKNMNLLFIDDGELHFERSKEIKSVISGYVVNDYNYEESKIKNKKRKVPTIK